MDAGAGFGDGWAQELVTIDVGADASTRIAGAGSASERSSSRTGFTASGGPPGWGEEDEWFAAQFAALEAAFARSGPPDDPGSPPGEPASPPTDGQGSDRDSDPMAVLESDTRTMDELRADILADMLLAGDATTLEQPMRRVLFT